MIRRIAQIVRKWANKIKGLILELAHDELDVIYDRFGAARLRILQNNRIVTWSGRQIGFLAGTAVHNSSGAHVGWYEGGILRDIRGATVGFGVSPTDEPHPYLPYKQYQPYRGYIQFAPYLPFAAYPHYPPYKQFGWSNVDPVSLFRGQQSA